MIADSQRLARRRHRASALTILLVGAGLVAASGCRREPPAEPAMASRTVSAPAAATAQQPLTPMMLDDVVERTPFYVVGISFPRHLERQPGLAKSIRDYADAARAELKRAVDDLDGERPTEPYALSLRFDTLADTPALIAIAADGSCYTGGAHGQPLVARFVWLKATQKRLTAAALIPDPRHWGIVATQVAARLHQAALARVQTDKLSSEEQARLLQSVDRMIAEGTGADAVNFEQFQPLLDVSGRITALRFVFPPYQVGPYSDGTQTADVPASVLLPLVAPEYAELFSMS